MKVGLDGSQDAVSSEVSVNAVPSIGHISVKSIPFYKKSPETWFRQMESKFHLANITKSATKYHQILSLLPEEIASYRSCV